MSAKATVIRQMLDRVFKVIPPNQALVATLGGEGLEAMIWEKLGIAPDNGWLIDMRPRVIKRLAAAHGRSGYHLSQKHFGRFAKQYAEMRGPEAGLDLLHVDLCGAVERVISELPTAIGLVAKGRARLLALTTSDKRRHPATDEPNGLRELLHTVFHERTPELISSIHQSHIAYEAACQTTRDADQSTLRELSTVLCLFLSQILGSEVGLAPSRRYHTLRDLWLRATSSKVKVFAPESMERVTFGSRGFSMRSYVFTISRQKTDLLSAVNGLCSVWLNPPSFFYDKSSRALLPINPNTQQEANVKRKMDEDLEAVITRLRAATGYLSPALAQDVDTLIRRASAPTVDIETIVGKLKLQASAKLEEAFAGFLASPETSPTTKPAAKPEGERAKAGSEREALEMSRKDDIRMRLLTAKHAGKDALDQAFAQLIKELKLTKAKERNQVVASYLAHTQGKFRRNFLARMLQRDPARILDTAEQLGSLYDMNRDDIIVEAKSSREWRLL